MKSKILALTFDACEAENPAWFDEGILQYLVNNKIPCTIFLSGNFAIRNGKRLKEISNYPFIEFGNHTFHHYQHSENLSKSGFMWELHATDSVIKNITGKTPKYFRFPGGNFNGQSLIWVKAAGLQTVHWSFASGDPDPKLSAKAIMDWVYWKTKPGNILIFHINGRGYKTAQILP
ncbi:MAG: polysaccharide deacetylase family protein, partial [Ignavibacteriales bacterium]|nr:polysaccharide deacetylase family protein [Ignavibacteriales bacterium]